MSGATKEASAIAVRINGHVEAVTIINPRLVQVLAALRDKGMHGHTISDTVVRLVERAIISDL